MLLAHIAPRRKRWIMLIVTATALPLMSACGAAPALPSTATPLAPTTLPAPGEAPTIYPGPAGTPTAYPAPVASPTPAAQATPVAPTAAAPSSRPTAPPAGTLPPLAGPGEAPADKVAAAIADLARRTGADPAAITIVSAEAVTWSDGALGCPQPGMAYTQALVDGYRLILRLNGATYAYHAAVNGDFFYCERPGR
ncbi:MAG: hypothetical protein RMK84_10475 [Oscillochloridaceae bacterium]|nr:hypothetical protein [Chloroflexaceae bacterium]MDW8390537.1 hypothetical protein [Oscillochloridaceae bacterium]